MTQGSVEGGLISSINLDVPIQIFFKDSKDEVSYGDIMLNTMIYQDDLTRLSGSIKSAKAGIDRVETCMETKMLDLHEDKSCIIILLQEVKRDMMKNPPTLYGKPLVEKTKGFSCLSKSNCGCSSKNRSSGSESSY